MSTELSYQDAVIRGRALLKSMRCHQVLIAFMAVKVCTISHGGAIGRKLYTIKDYAHDIGMNRKTLSGWTEIYRTVITKLDIDVNEITLEDWAVAARVHSALKDHKRSINDLAGTPKVRDKGWKINAPAGQIKDMFDKFKRQRPVQLEINSWTDSIITISNKLKSKDLSGASTDSLMMMKKRLDGASDNITNYLLDERGVTIGELL